MPLFHIRDNPTQLYENRTADILKKFKKLLPLLYLNAVFKNLRQKEKNLLYYSHNNVSTSESNRTGFAIFVLTNSRKLKFI